MTTDMSFADILVDVIDQEARQNGTGAVQSGRLTLHLTDLIEDSNGEVVLFNDSHLPRLAVATDIVAVGRGEAGRHVTANGDDVSGFHFITFDNGMKLYYQDGLDLVLVGEDVPA